LIVTGLQRIQIHADRIDPIHALGFSLLEEDVDPPPDHVTP
jgi:hypothetical protein